MNDLMIKLTVLFDRFKDENGQDLVEYALVVALIAFAAVGSMKLLATDINGAFATIGTDLTTAMA